MMAMASLVISVRDMPLVLADLRRELASILRETAETEASPHMRRRLQAIAAAFESGQREWTDG